MRNLTRNLVMLALCGALALPVSVVSATERGKQQRTEQRGHNGSGRPQRPGNSGNSNHNSNRPDNKHNKHNFNKQDSKPGGQPGMRPGANNGNVKPNQPGNRPGANNGNIKPNQPGKRPGANNGHLGPNRPGNTGNNIGNHRPNRPGSFTPPPPPPHRPNRPVWAGWNTWHRPTPPPSWRPRPGVPSLNTILGVALGTALAQSLTTLTHNGYLIDGYQDGRVYLRDVNQLNYYWPDAVLLYNNGYLAGSEYSYSTAAYDIARYNGVYNSLFATYGAPVDIRRFGNGYMTATWFLPSSGFVTLKFEGLSSGAGMRYFTTLSVGQY